MIVRPFAVLAASFLLAACSAPQGGLTPGGSPGTAPASHRARASLRVRVRVPRKHKHGRGSRYLSYATAGLSIAITGPTNVTDVVGLTVTSNPQGCSSSLTGTFCTLTIAGLQPCPGSANCYTANVSTWDAVSCASGTCTIPVTADELSANQNVGFSIAAGTSNAIALTLEGIPYSVAVIAEGSSSLSGNATTGFGLSKCATTAQAVSVVSEDADGNFILGPGAPAVTLSSNDTTHLAVPAASASAPNRFLLTPPATLATATIPNANAVVQLTATATPGSGSGASAKTANVNVTFNTDVCGVVTEYSTPTSNSQPFGIVTGPDGNLWFTEFGQNKIGKVTTNGTIHEYSGLTGGQPSKITVGSDGNLWFVEGPAKIGTITTAGSIDEYSSGLATTSAPTDIASGPDGALWFTLANVAAIGTIPTTGSPITQYTSGMTGSARPTGIAVGADNALWFGDTRNTQVGKITTSGAIVEYSPAGLALGAAPGYIAAGPDDAMWFTECTQPDIGRITLDGGTVTNYAIPSGNAGFTIAGGPDGALWFTEQDASRIGRVTTGGNVTEFSSGISSNPGLQGIATGPDGAIWFAEGIASKIGRMQ